MISISFLAEATESLNEDNLSGVGISTLSIRNKAQDNFSKWQLLHDCSYTPDWFTCSFLRSAYHL